MSFFNSPGKQSFESLDDDHGYLIHELNAKNCNEWSFWTFPLTYVAMCLVAQSANTGMIKRKQHMVFVKAIIQPI